MLGAKQDSVALTPYHPSWRYRFQIEVIALRRALKSPNLYVEHIGSTAIPNIAAKAILDLLVYSDAKTEALDLVEDLAALNYRCISNDSTCQTFVKEKGDVITHHLIFANPESKHWQNAIEFRDCMLKHPTLAKHYELEKLRLATLFPSSSKDYLSARAGFIETVLTTSDATLSKGTTNPSLLLQDHAVAKTQYR